MRDHAREHRAAGADYPFAVLDPVVCEECGNDLAVEGYRYCLDCLEAGAAD